MKRTMTLLLALTCASILGNGPTQQDLIGQNGEEVSFGDLSEIGGSGYKVDPYIHAAWALQQLGKEKAIKNLTRLAQDKKKGRGAIVLCRMLFIPKLGSKFERPALGGPIFLGETDGSDWPLEPIEIVDGVPFLVTKGYILGGKAESPSQYLEYCNASCHWNRFSYKPQRVPEKRKALAKLLSSGKWKVALDKTDREFFEAQID